MRFLRTTISCVVFALLIGVHPPVVESAGLNFPLESKWQVALPAAPDFPPAYDATQAYIALGDKHLVALSLETGKTMWSVECPMTSPPAAGDAFAFAGGDGFVEARARTDGRMSWHTAVTGTVTSLYWDTGWLIAMTNANVLLAIRATDGGILWQRDINVALQGPPAPAADRLYLPLKDGTLVALQLATGEPIWTVKMPMAANAVLPVGDRIYLSALDKRFYCLVAETGKIAWSWKTGAEVIGMPVLDERRAYFVSLDNVLRALDRRSGSVRWQKALPTRPSSGPLLTGWTLIVPGISAEIHAFSAQFDGKPIGDKEMLSAEGSELRLAGPPHLTANDWVVLITRGGQVQAFAGSPYPFGP